MISVRITAFAPALFAATLLAGCSASPGVYPSLAPRPIERTAIEEPAVPPEETAARAFAVELETARKAVATAAGQVVGSEAWVAAQQALSRLDQRRWPVTAALANLDAMMVGAGGAPSVALGNAWARVARINDDQRDAFDALAAKLSQP